MIKKYRNYYLELWKGVEQLITEGKVGGAGLCDLHPPVFVSIYQQAAVKPTSIQVRILITVSDVSVWNFVISG